LKSHSDSTNFRYLAYSTVLASNILNIVVVRVFVKMLSVKNSDIASVLEPGH